MNIEDRIPVRSRREASFNRQRARRLAEWRRRRKAVSITRRLQNDGRTGSWVADRLGVVPRTLNHWKHQERRGRLHAYPRGRPPREPSPETRQDVLQTIDKQGAHLGLPTLKSLLPGVHRGVLRDLRDDYRTWHRAQFHTVAHRLTWHQVGAVWAIDHTEPPAPIDGIYGSVLGVRDLASGYQLAWLPVLDQTAAVATTALAGLFRYYGAPLVLKSDNGSAFISEQFGALLAENRVAQLFSPARRPQYNGSCEAANGAMKIRTQHFADRARRPFAWESCDLHAALHQANEIHRSEDNPDRSAKERWQQRPKITVEARNALRDLICSRRVALWSAAAQAASRPARQHLERKLERTAIAQALQSLGILTLKRRRIHLPFNHPRLARFS